MSDEKGVTGGKDRGSGRWEGSVEKSIDSTGLA